jgi:hypothetical protein
LVTVLQNNMRCDYPDGMASASVGGVTEGYTFDWYDVALNYISSGTVVTNLSAGNYTVIATDQLNATNVGMIQFTILDQIVVPEVSLESIPNTSCFAVGNGALITTVAGTSTDYTYAWYEGADPQGSFISSNVHLTDRSGGAYTLQVTNILSGCYTRISAQIVDEPAIPVVNVAATNNTDCTTPNGTLNAVTEEHAMQYSFTWYTSDLNPIGVTSPFVEHLAAGNYVVTVVDGVTGCTSTSAAVINDNCDFTSPGFSGAANNVITSEKKLEGTGIGYYPNPASETLWVSSTGPAALALINHSGEIVLRQNVYLTDTPFALDLSGLKPGGYILNANEGGNLSNFQIVIKK